MIRTQTSSKSKRTRHNGHALHSDIARIKHAFAGTASTMRGKAGDLLSHSMENIKERSLDVRDSVADYTAERPFKTLGIALLAGAVVGFLLRRK